MELLKKENSLLVDVKTEQMIRKYLPKKDNLTPLTNLFAALADQSRLQIITALSISQLCVGDLSALLQVNQTTLSHQLKTLRDARIVSSYKQGKTVFYSIREKALDELMLSASILTD